MNFGCARQALEPEIHLCLELCGISAPENLHPCSGHHAFLSVPCSAMIAARLASTGGLIASCAAKSPLRAGGADSRHDVEDTASGPSAIGQPGSAVAFVRRLAASAARWRLCQATA